MPIIEQQEKLGWGNPDEAGFSHDHIVSIAAGGIRVTCHKELAPHFTYL